MANPQPNDPHLIMAHSINEAIMQRDFTKRQRKVLDLILRLSWGCNKKFAIIPRLSDFEIVGVGKTHISVELRWLQESKVIYIDQSQYSFNKDFDQWQVSRVMPFTPDRLKKLISLNLHSSYQIGNSVPSEVTKTVTPKLPKQELSGYLNSNSATSALASAKESIKENIIENTAAAGTEEVTELVTNEDPGTGEYFKLYEENIGMIMPLIADELKDICHEYPLEWFKAALFEACANQARNLKYIRRILERWKTEGFKAPRKGGQSGRMDGQNASGYESRGSQKSGNEVNQPGSITARTRGNSAAELRASLKKSEGS